MKKFRQIDSKTPGHPEYRITSGVETTTGPLGQGCGNSVGLAMAERFWRSRYNKPGFDAVRPPRLRARRRRRHDGRGVAEAASTAGHLQLGNLTWIYDSNHITIEGGTDLAFDEDVGARLRPMAGTCSMSRTPTTSAPWPGARATPRRSPTGRASSWCTASSATARRKRPAPTRRMASRWAKRRYAAPSAPMAGRRTRTFLVPDGVYEHFQQGIGKRGAKLRPSWMDADGYKAAVSGAGAPSST